MEGYRRPKGLRRGGVVPGARCQMCKAELGDDLEGRSSYSCNHMPVDNQEGSDGKRRLAVLDTPYRVGRCQVRVRPPLFAGHY
jgi:hypothetical protein